MSNDTTASASTESFAEWLAREMPAGTVISNQAWWAPRILRAALARAPLPAEGGAQPADQDHSEGGHHD